MSVDSTWANVPLIKDGTTTFSEAGLNPTIKALEARTNYLLDAFNGLSGNQGYVLPIHGISSDCKKGSLIAFDPAQGIYTPAKAAWNDKKTTYSDGSLIPSPLASVLGVLVDNPSQEGTGMVLCQGWSRDPEIIKALAPDGVCGDYYLSTNPGKASVFPATGDSGGVRVYCYSFLSTGASVTDTTGTLYINPGRPEYGGHSHSYATIKDNSWVTINTANKPSSLPDEAKVYIDTDATGLDDIREIIKSNPIKPCLIKDGSEVSRDIWGIQDNYIYLEFVPIKGDKFSIHAINPLYADQPIINGIKKIGGDNNKLLNITSASGKTWIGVNTNPVSTDNYIGTGLISVSQEGFKVGPIVQGIKAGAGINIKTYNDMGTDVPGVVEVSSAQYKGTLIDMSVVNLNNVSVGTSFYGVSYIFPGVGSSLVGTIRVPHYEGNSQEGEIILLFQGNRSTINNLTLHMSVQPLPTPGGAGQPITNSTAYTVPSISATDEGLCYSQAVTIDSGILRSDGLVICKLVSNSNSVINLVSMSLRLK